MAGLFGESSRDLANPPPRNAKLLLIMKLMVYTTKSAGQKRTYRKSETPLLRCTSLRCGTLYLVGSGGHELHSSALPGESDQSAGTSCSLKIDARCSFFSIFPDTPNPVSLPGTFLEIPPSAPWGAPGPAAVPIPATEAQPLLKAAEIWGLVPRILN